MNGFQWGEASWFPFFPWFLLSVQKRVCWMNSTPSEEGESSYLSPFWNLRSIFQTNATRDTVKKSGHGRSWQWASLFKADQQNKHTNPPLVPLPKASPSRLDVEEACSEIVCSGNLSVISVTDGGMPSTNPCIGFMMLQWVRSTLTWWTLAPNERKTPQKKTEKRDLTCYSCNIRVRQHMFSWNPSSKQITDQRNQRNQEKYPPPPKPTPKTQSPPTKKKKENTTAKSARRDDFKPGLVAWLAARRFLLRGERTHGRSCAAAEWFAPLHIALDMPSEGGSGSGEGVGVVL